MILYTVYYDVIIFHIHCAPKKRTRPSADPTHNCGCRGENAASMTASDPHCNRARTPPILKSITFSTLAASRDAQHMKRIVGSIAMHLLRGWLSKRRTTCAVLRSYSLTLPSAPDVRNVSYASGGCVAYSEKLGSATPVTARE